MKSAQAFIAQGFEWMNLGELGGLSYQVLGAGNPVRVPVNLKWDLIEKSKLKSPI